MQAAVISELGGAPTVQEWPEPAADDGQTVVETGAAALNPVDLAIAAGVFTEGAPGVPYVPGREGHRTGGLLTGVCCRRPGEHECSSVLQLMAACRGALNGLMAEVLEGHIRFHVLDPKSGKNAPQVEAAEELIDVVRTYLK